jgi:hypothetical protein
VFWRGRTTGEWFNRAHDWRFSHRVRIHTLATPGGNLTDPNVTPEVEVLVEDELDGSVHPRTYSRDTLNDKYMDVSLIGGPVQCDDSEKDRTCQEMADGLYWGKETGWEAGLSNKYLLDIGMFSSRYTMLYPLPYICALSRWKWLVIPFSEAYDIWSVCYSLNLIRSRVYKLIAFFTSVIFKMTIFPEWNSDWWVFLNSQGLSSR